MAQAWFAFYPGDYLRDTAHLSLVQHGAYLKLIAHQYTSRAPLPANAEQLHRICSVQTPEEREAVDTVIAQFFTLIRGRSGGYVQPRIVKEIEKQGVISEKRSASAKQMHSKSSANALQKHSLTTTTTTYKKKRGERAIALPPDFTLTDERRTYAEQKGIRNPAHEFESFREYHTAKGSAFKSWDAAWRTWCLKAKKFGGKHEIPRKLSAVERVRAVTAARDAEIDAEEHERAMAADDRDLRPQVVEPIR